MPAITYTANAGTDQLTATAHGLVTGDGPVVVRKGTAATVLAAPLAEVTEYWAIRIDANTLQLATSQANALANTFVPLTTAGSGTQILEYGLPYIRPRTYVANVGGPGTPTPGSQIRAADFNAEFASWTSLHRLLTGQSQSVWTGINNASKYYHSSVETERFTFPLAFTGAVLAPPSGTLTLGTQFSGAGNGFQFGLPVPLGRRIVGARTRVQAGASSTIKASLVRNVTGVNFVYATPASGNTSAHVLTFSSPTAPDLFIDPAVESLWYVAWEFVTGSTTSTVYSFEYDYVYQVP